MTKDEAIRQCKHIARKSQLGSQFYAARLDGKYTVISFDELMELRRQHRDPTIIHAEYAEGE